MRCKFNLAPREHARQACESDAMPGKNRCEMHRNDLPGWAQHTLDETFGAHHVARSRPDDGHTRYRVESPDGAYNWSPTYLGKTAFLDAISMLHAAMRHREKLGRCA